MGNTENRAGWLEMFQGGLAIPTVLLNIGIGLHAIDVFIVSSTMPAIVRDIGGAHFYAWATMLYMVTSIIGAASSNPLRNRFGSRSTYVIAICFFLVGSMGCALSPHIAPFLLARTVQGAGGGLLTALSMTLVSDLFPAHLRKRVLASISSTWGVAAILGPAVGGFFAHLGWWRGAFWINVPVILCFLAMALRHIGNQRPSTFAGQFPLRRLALLTTGVLCVGLASYATQMVVQAGLIGLAVLLVLATLKLDGHGGNRLFPSQPLSIATPTGCSYWIAFLSSLMHTVTGVFLPLALQVLHGMNAASAGYTTAALALCWTLSSVATSGWHGVKAARAIVLGPVISWIALSMLAIAIHGWPTWTIPLLTSLIGLGLGSSNLHVVAATMRHAASGEEAITASSLPTIRSLGIAFGAAGAGLVANSAGLTDQLLPTNVAAAVGWVFAIGAIAPFLSAFFSFRFILLTQKLEAQTPAAA